MTDATDVVRALEAEADALWSAYQVTTATRQTIRDGAREALILADTACREAQRRWTSAAEMVLELRARAAGQDGAG